MAALEDFAGIVKAAAFTHACSLNYETKSQVSNLSSHGDGSPARPGNRRWQVDEDMTEARALPKSGHTALNRSPTSPRCCLSTSTAAVPPALAHVYQAAKTSQPVTRLGLFRECRIEDVTCPHTYAIACISPTVTAIIKSAFVVRTGKTNMARLAAVLAIRVVARISSILV